MTFTATVSPATSGLPTPTGTVKFEDGSTIIGSGTLNASGVATFTTSTLAVGTHSIKAVYGGDGNFSGITSSAVTQIVQAPQLVLNSVLEIRTANVLDSNDVTLNYTISDASIVQLLLLDVYQSPTPTFTTSTVLLGYETLNNLPQGSQSITIPLNTTPIATDPTRPYIVVVANANNSVTEAAGSVNSVSTTNSPPFTPDQIREAYGLPPIEGLPNSLSGAGQTIAIVGIDDDPNIVSDLAKFDTTFNLPFGNLIVENSSGQTNALPPVGSAKSQAEEALDVEWVHAIAPGANIVLIEAKSDSSSLVPDFFNAIQQAASIPDVSVVSLSLAYYLSTSYLQIPYWINNGFDNLYFNVTGVTFVAGSGDEGPSTSYPAISPDVVSVGGTYLSLNNDNSYNSEQYWSVSSDSGGLSGGYGVTSLEAEPAYQAGVQSTGDRAFPDVSFDAGADSPVYTYTSAYQSPWFANYGTSLAAPCWAALIAIANQERVAPGGAGSLFSNSTNALTALYDIPHSDYNQTTGVQYDPNTGDSYNGLGTPRANQLLTDLSIWKPISLPISSLATSIVGSTYNQQIVASGGTGNSTLTITPTWATYPVGLTFDNSTNNTLKINGLPTAAGAYSFSVTATDTNGFATTQNYTLIVSPRDVTGQVSSSASGLVYNRGTKLFGQSVTFTNTGSSDLVGTLEIVLTGLPTGVTLANISGYTANGDPYILVNLASPIASGQSFSISLFFSNPSLEFFFYGFLISDDNSD